MKDEFWRADMRILLKKNAHQKKRDLVQHLFNMCTHLKDLLSWSSSPDNDFVILKYANSQPLITKVVIFYPPHSGSNLLEKLIFGNNYWQYSINGRACKTNAFWKAKGITIEKQIFIIIQYNQPITREMRHRKSFWNILGNSRRMSNLVYGIGGSQCQFKNFLWWHEFNGIIFILEVPRWYCLISKTFSRKIWCRFWYAEHQMLVLHLCNVEHSLYWQFRVSLPLGSLCLTSIPKSYDAQLFHNVASSFRFSYAHMLTICLSFLFMCSCWDGIFRSMNVGCALALFYLGRWTRYLSV